jgi:hypothetical protein
MVLYIRFCICFLDWDYVLHSVNFAILYDTTKRTFKGFLEHLLCIDAILTNEEEPFAPRCFFSRKPKINIFFGWKLVCNLCFVLQGLQSYLKKIEYNHILKICYIISSSMWQQMHMLGGCFLNLKKNLLLRFY